MAHKYVAYDIVYDLDDELVTDLPKTVPFTARNHREAMDVGADKISEETGWCVLRFKIKKG